MKKSKFVRNEPRHIWLPTFFNTNEFHFFPLIETTPPQEETIPEKKRYVPRGIAGRKITLLSKTQKRRLRKKQFMLAQKRKSIVHPPVKIK